MFFGWWVLSFLLAALAVIGRAGTAQAAARAEELAELYGMRAHEENGSFVERHYDAAGEARAASGCIYYHLAPGEVSMFHVIDCDEYWSWHAGTPLEIWMVSPDGVLSRSTLGIGRGMEPTVLIRAGIIFGARPAERSDDGTFLSCITVPRFRYDGWRLVPRDEVASLCPEADGFFE